MRCGGWRAMDSAMRTLGSLTADRVRVLCDRCPRKGNYSKARLIERYGADINLVALLNEFQADCPGYIAVRQRRSSEGCGAKYDFAPADRR